LPIVLMADRQPTGGYPKIGTVIRADLPRLAQTRPGHSLRFVPVTVADAVTALRAAVPTMAAMQPHLRRISIAAARG
jgi:allophanate hydrolase subunit 2